jgi:hydroxyacylglutathione hydrolase
VKSFPFSFGDIQVVQMINGQIQENAYLVRHSNKDAVLIDPGDEADAILQTVQASDVNVLAILLTHAHFDHIGAVQPLREALQAKVYLHKEAWDSYSRAHMAPARYNLPFQQPQAPDEILEPGLLKFGALEFTALFTPGHAPGHLSFYSSAGFLLSGDALFNNSIGRTDIPGASHELLLERIKTQLYTLPDETVVLSGHGRDTTIGREKAGNPFTQSLI